MTSRIRFADCELDRARFELRRTGAIVHVEPRVLDLLCYLIDHRDRVVPKTELLDAVWGDRFVSDSALTGCLRDVRRAVGDTGADQAVIRTIARRGYQFVAALDAEPREQSKADPGQHIRFVTAHDGVRIAYAQVGSGPPLMKAANWLSHLDLEWSSPVWAHWVRDLATTHTLVRYDERGCGMSQWEVGDFGFADWVADLATVVEASGLDRFPLLGVSQGAAVAIAYAVQHPERVSRLILAGGYPRGRLVRAATEEERQAARLDLDLARVGLARDESSFLQVFAAQFLPDGGHEEWGAFVEYLRRTTSPANVVRFLEAFAMIDVVELARQVTTPTLILHARDDVRVPVSCATELAALIPGSRLALLEGRNHLLGVADPSWAEFLTHVEAFLGEE